MIGIDIAKERDWSSIPCLHCLGTGTQKAMQMAMTYDVGSKRAKDTKVKCKHCNGKGFTIR